MLGTNMTYTWLKKHCRLKCITLEGWGFKDSFIQSKFKGLSTKVYIVTSCSCRRKSQGYFEECRCLFMSPKKAFRSYLMIFKGKDLWCALYRWSCGLISKKTGSLQCRRFYRARANGFNRESAMLKLPKRGGNGFLCHRIKDGGFIVVIRLTSFRPRKTRLHCRLENWEPSDPFCNTSLWETLIL